MLEVLLEATLAGGFGLLIGSFLNVCIYRWPRDLSVVRPRSFCPGCEQPVAAYDNIPVLSYLLLRGKCRRCGAPIPWRYPLVELLTAAAFLWFTATEGLTLAAARDCSFAAILVALVFADLETLLLPDELTLGGLALGFAWAWFVPVHGALGALLLGSSQNPHVLSMVESLLGALIPSGALWLTGLLYQRLRHREGLGFGDVKMLAMMGAFLGLASTLLALVAGSLLGSVLGLGYIVIAKKNAAEYELPFGVFLGIGGLLALTAGASLLHWYGALV